MTNIKEFAELLSIPENKRLIGLDPGTKRIGLAITDETQTLARPLARVDRTSWKKLVQHLISLIDEFDACLLVIGLPLDSEGKDTHMTAEAKEMARKLALSLKIPVVLQDERVSSYEAKSRLWERGTDLETSRDLVDSEAAVVILEDVLAELTLLRKTSS